MTVKSVMAGKRPVINPFPKLMIFRDGTFIVLFKAYKEGVVVWTESEPWSLGDDCFGWVMDEFEDFDGFVTLSNEK